MASKNQVTLNVSLLTGQKRSVILNVSELDELELYLRNEFNLSENSYFLKHSGNGGLLGNIQVIPKLCGGKGGFGSMLRAIGAQIEKTTNREACRDLSGRRLRDINEEQRLKKWISQKADRKREAEERKKKKLEKLSSEPKVEFSDKNYETERADLVEKISSSVEQGIKAASSSKRSSESNEKPQNKKKKLILDFDEDLLSSDDSISEDSSERRIDIK